MEASLLKNDHWEYVDGTILRPATKEGADAATIAAKVSLPAALRTKPIVKLKSTMGCLSQSLTVCSLNSSMCVWYSRI
uniref:Uncharacterized protein n=1 Tax=Timema monikensis TaxID=170555 RepID=A0A7R9EH22_9NEOP|nr:unnamed protein product [Timema monikensis]